ncbi:MAG: hypothetical protein M1826_002114 [Phylliscum demangeonii]|nr:MAG: hypothetical protein M1826_002114 [Phylliscum demangeonii]
MPTPAPSTNNVRVSVEWDEEPIYAGERLRCKITFTNVAPSLAVSRTRSTAGQPNGMGAGEERKERLLRTQSVKSRPRDGPSQDLQAQAPSRPLRAHRQTLSLSVPRAGGLGKPATGSTTPFSGPVPSNGHPHQRSLSIVTLGGVDAERKGAQIRTGMNVLDGGPPTRHGRAASLQISPRRMGALNGTPLSPARSAEPSGLLEFDYQRPSAHNSGVFTAPPTPALAQQPARGPSASSSVYTFSAMHPSDSSHGTSDANLPSPTTPVPRLEAPAVETPRDEDSDREESLPATKALVALSINGATPRSSSEFFTMSNNSTETLASEYLAHPPPRLLSSPNRSRQGSILAPARHQRQPESLMMGYAQVLGSFTVDGSLVNPAPFEAIKRKGVISGMGGGGVVGVETKSNGGLLGALGWAQLGHSIGGILGAGELSSLKEMKGVAKSKAIPLLSTPQSLLFVDLLLAPGESRSYRYSFPLPNGLPPTHKGRAVRISYRLVIGTQRPGTSQHPQQQVRQVDIPFRVYGGVNADGEPMGHDLLSPHIILQDHARTSSISPHEPSRVANGPASPSTTTASSSSREEFDAYVRTLLARRPGPGDALRSPTDERLPSDRRPSTISMAGTAPAPAPAPMRELIDTAILRASSSIPSTGSGSASASTRRSPNRFDISRNGQRVATISLARPAYRLGETVTAAIELGRAQIRSYAVLALLETAEAIDASLALRSHASVYRVTRKTQAAQSETTLFAQRVVCSLRIPLSATPSFLSTGVSLAWTLRVEFVTPRMARAEEEDEGGGGGGGDEAGADVEGDGKAAAAAAAESLMEELFVDDRGVTLAAVEHLRGESFEVGIPLTVYGPAVSSDGAPSGRDGQSSTTASDVGLPV